MSVQRVATVQERLIEVLNVRNITQSELGRASGITRDNINKYVKGRAIPSMDRIHMMSNALCISEIWLLGYDVPME